MKRFNTHTLCASLFCCPVSWHGIRDSCRIGTFSSFAGIAWKLCERAANLDHIHVLAWSFPSFLERGRSLCEWAANLDHTRGLAWSFPSSRVRKTATILKPMTDPLNSCPNLPNLDRVRIALPTGLTRALGESCMCRLRCPSRPPVVRLERLEAACDSRDRYCDSFARE